MEDVSFALVAQTIYGPMILHRMDPSQGVPAICTGKPTSFNEITMLSSIVPHLGENPVFLDIGSNVGFFTIALAPLLGPGGKVYSFEGQRVMFNMLAGSVVLNSLLNVNCANVCVGRESGVIELPAFDYRRPLSFGSIEFGPAQKEKLAQDRQTPVEKDYVPLITVDSLSLAKVSLIKIDVEGMELDVLEGAEATIRRDRPVMFIEYLKVGLEALEQRLAALDYLVADTGGYNLIAIPRRSQPGIVDPATFIQTLTQPPADVLQNFDPAVYLELNPDVVAAGFDARYHFIVCGWREGRPYSN